MFSEHLCVMFFLHTVMWFQIFLCNINNCPISIWSIDWTLIGMATPGEESTWELCQWRGTQYSPLLQIWNLTIRCRLLCRGYSQPILRPIDREEKMSRIYLKIKWEKFKSLNLKWWEQSKKQWKRKKFK